ncbi:hypothetical protein, partial [Burkholderia mallei]
LFYQAKRRIVKNCKDRIDGSGQSVFPGRTLFSRSRRANEGAAGKRRRARNDPGGISMELNNVQVNSIS